MKFNEALMQRNSVRKFQRKSVPQAVIDRILNDAIQAPSWSNTQPYMFAVAQGEVRDALQARYCERFDKAQALQASSPLKRLFTVLTRGRKNSGAPTSDYQAHFEYPEELLPRRRKTGFGLYQWLDIERHDMHARQQQMRQNYAFFDAPVVIFIFAHEGLGVYSVLDAGIMMQSLMLSATTHGLGTCAQGALAIWTDPVRDLFDVPPAYKMLCGLSLGYPADHKINQFRPGREALSQFQIPEKRIIPDRP